MHQEIQGKSDGSLPTQFAPAERSTAAEVEASGHSISSSEVVRSILDSMPECVMVLNKNRQIVFGNRAVVELAGLLGKSDFLGLRPGEFLSCRNALSVEGGCGTAEACCTCGAVLAILQAIVGRRSCQECRISRQTQSAPQTLDFRVTATPFLWQDEEFVLFVATDIADEKRRRVLERIFFHDILNTAGVINTITDLLAQGQVEADEVKGDLSVASTTLVNEIKSQRILLAAENSELAVNWGPVNTADFLETLVHTYEKHEVALEKKIVIAPARADCSFITDPTLLLRVLGNLLKNALEASSSGEVVTLGCRQDGDEVTFTCHNRSVMPREVRLQIFQRSFSTKSGDRGIGTYSVKLLTEKYLHGRVSFVSEEGTGTVFSVTLPPKPPGAALPEALA